MIVYIHLQQVEYVDPIRALCAMFNVYGLQGVYRNVTPSTFPDDEYLYQYTASIHDGDHLQNFIDFLCTRKYCKDISVE